MSTEDIRLALAELMDMRNNLKLLAPLPELQLLIIKCDIQIIKVREQLNKMLTHPGSNTFM